MCNECTIIKEQEDVQKIVRLETSKTEYYSSDKINADYYSIELGGVELKSHPEAGKSDINIWHYINKISSIEGSVSNSSFSQEKTVLVPDNGIEEAMQTLWDSIKEGSTAQLINKRVSDAEIISADTTQIQPVNGDSDILGTPA
jgi:hypothetical protein